MLHGKVSEILAKNIGDEKSAIRELLAAAVIRQMADKRTLVDFSKAEFIRRYEESSNPEVRKSAIQWMGLIAPRDADVRQILLANATDGEVDETTRAVALRLYHPDDIDAQDALRKLLGTLPTDQKLRLFKDLHAAYVECLSRFPVATVSDMQKWLEGFSGQDLPKIARRPRVVAYALGAWIRMLG